jgi:hypothetical protein
MHLMDGNGIATSIIASSCSPSDFLWRLASLVAWKNGTITGMPTRCLPEDSDLLMRAELRATGANVHRVRGAMAGLLTASQLLSRTAMGDPDRAVREAFHREQRLALCSLLEHGRV